MKRFLTDVFDEEKANVIVFGVETGKNAALTLNSFRNTSWFVEFIDADSKKNLLENVRVHDMGNIDVEKITEKVREMRKEQKVPLMLSVAHLSTLKVLKGIDRSHKLIVFDAHADLHDKYIDEKIERANSKGVSNKMNDATWLRRYCDEFGKKNVMLIGLRSDTEDVLPYLKDFNHFTSTYTKNNLSKVKRKISEFSRNSNIYISIDIDVFDPSVAPAVEYPEPDGLMFSDFKELISSVRGKLIGMDLTCLAFPNSVTEFLACKSIFYTLNLLNE